MIRASERPITLLDFFTGRKNGDRAAAADRDAPPPRRPTIGLALGGGAARGFAHIGVIRTLVSKGLTPDVIDRPLAVRYQHGLAKSADAPRFMVEYAPVAEGFDRQLAWHEFVAYAAYRLAIRLLWAQYGVRKRLGLLDLRERLGWPAR